MSDPNLDKHAEAASATPASSPDELIKDLDVSLSESEQGGVVGGKAGKAQQEFLILKMTDVLITGT